MSRVFAAIQNLSLDVTAGAVVSSLFICQYFGVEASFEVMLGLGIAIWLIYTIDHLRDAPQLPDDTANPRHAFHRKYRVAILIGAAMAFTVGLINAFQLPTMTIKAGLVLGVLSGLYFAYLKFSSGQRLKELFAAVIYTAGIFAGPVSLITQWEWTYLIFFLLFFLLVAANLVLFPLYEMEIDGKDRVKSIALKTGRKRTVGLVWSLLGLHLVLVIISVISLPLFSGPGYVFLTMNIVLVILLIWPTKFKNRQLYRWMGDGIFFIPLLVLL